MKHAVKIIFAALAAALGALPLQAAAASRAAKYDICVYGATPAGVTAAIEAARSGKRTLLVAAGNHIGGVATSGLTATDINRHTVIGGIAEEFYGRIYEHYLSPSAWRCQERDEFMTLTLKRTFSGKNDARRMQWVYESGVGERIMLGMLDEAGVEVLRSAPIELERGVKKRKNAISAIRLTDGTTVEAAVFIDASYEGDLMAQAGVSYISGREPQSRYNESLAGISLGERIKLQPFKDEEHKQLWPNVYGSLWDEEGEGDNRTQSYCYRLTLTDDPQNLRPIECPEDYDPEIYAVVAAHKIWNNPDVELKNVITFTPMPNRKTDTNHLDFVGASYDYAEAGYAERRNIERAHRNYALGMLWFLGHDERVPERLRNEMLRWGLAKDEFTDNGNFPVQLYVREARRMVGDFVMTEHNVRKSYRVDAGESAGVGSYMLDCHYVSYVADGDCIRIEGGIFESTRPYAVSVRALMPRESECSNLLVPVCLSASHVAYSSLRMEPTFMVLGQSAGAAAVLAAENGCAVQKIDYNQLKRRLEAEGQILDPAKPATTK